MTVHSILGVSKCRTKRINLRGSKILVVEEILLPLKFILFVFPFWRHPELNVKLKILTGVNCLSN